MDVDAVAIDSAIEEEGRLGRTLWHLDRRAPGEVIGLSIELSAGSGSETMPLAPVTPLASKSRA